MKTNGKSIHQIKALIDKKMHNKYFINEFFYGAKVVNEIMYNKHSTIVATFKNYLILDDYSEFLKRFYTLNESSIRLKKYFEYYETYSRIYPNYTALPESKYIYKNIHKKQKMIDLQQELEISLEKKKQRKKPKKKESINILFSTEVYNSLQNDSSYIERIFCFENNDKKIARLYQQANKIINEIKICEDKLNIISMTKPSKMIGSIISSNFNGNNVINTNNSIFKNININIFNEIQIGNNPIITGTHRKTLSTNNSKSKNYYNIESFSSSKLSSNISPLLLQERDKEKIKVNIKSKRFYKHTNKNSIKKNYDTHNRNHNCLLTNRGQIFNSQTLITSSHNITHNSGKRVNTNINIERNSTKNLRSQLAQKTTRLKTERPQSTFELEFLLNLMQKSLANSKPRVNTKFKKAPSNIILNTVRNKSINKKKIEKKLFNKKFEYKKFYSNNISLSSSRKISINVTRSGNNSAAISKANSKTKIGKDKMDYGIENNKSNKEVIKVQTYNKKPGILFVSPHIQSAIKGIKIRNFNKVKNINQFFSPLRSSSDSNRKIKSIQPLTVKAFRKTIKK